MTEEFNYLSINHTNRFTSMIKDEEVNTSNKFLNMVLNCDGNAMRKELSKFYNTIIESNSSDFIMVNIDQTQKYLKKFPFSKDEFNSTVNSFLSYEFKGIFKFSKENTEMVTRILWQVFKKLKSKGKDYGIKTFQDTTDKIKIVLNQNIDVVKLFINTEEAMSRQQSLSQSPNSISSREGKLAYSLPLNYKDIDSTNWKLKTVSKFYQYPNIKKPSDFILPVEMILLLNKLDSVKNISFSFEDFSEKQKEEMMIILLNRQWLFPNCIGIYINLGNETIQKEINEIFKNELNKMEKEYNTSINRPKYDSNFNAKCSWHPHSDLLMKRLNDSNILARVEEDSSSSSSMSINKSNTRSESDDLDLKTFPQIIKNNSYFFESIALLSYFITNIKNLKVLSFNFNDTFSYEIVTTLKQQHNLSFSNFNLFESFLEIYKLNELRLEFNALNKNIFESIITLVYKNANLQNLYLNIFSPEENYSASSLLKLCKCSGHNLELPAKERRNNLEMEDLDMIISKQLLDSFKLNMQSLFFALRTKMNLKSIIFFFDMPRILLMIPGYKMIIIKFILNFLILLAYESHSYKTVEIIAPYLKLDSRYFPMINDLFDEIDLRLLKNISKFTLRIQMFKVVNIGNLISCNFCSLFLGDLDEESFRNFVNYYISSDFIEKSQLEKITLTLSKVVTFQDVKEEIRKFVLAKPKRLEECYLITSMEIVDIENIQRLFYLIFYEAKTEKIVIRLGSASNDLISEVLSKEKEEIRKAFLVCKRKFGQKYKDILMRLKKFFTQFETLSETKKKRIILFEKNNSNQTYFYY